MPAGGIVAAGVLANQSPGTDQLPQVLLQEWPPHKGRHHYSQQHRLLQGHHGPGLVLL